MVIQNMKIEICLLLNKLANRGLNVVKYMNIKVLNEKVNIKTLNKQGIFSSKYQNGFNTFI